MTFRVLIQIFAVIATIGLQVHSAAGALSASEKPITTVTIEDLANVMRDAGYRAKIVEEKDHTYLQTGLGGYNVLVLFYDCTNKKCESFQFSVEFEKAPKFNLKSINRWNTEMRFGKAYLNKEGVLNIDLDVSLAGGVTQDFLKEQLHLFEHVLANFDRFDFN